MQEKYLSVAKMKKIKKLMGKLRHNHALMMILCCGLPLVILLVAVSYFGVSRSYLFWGILLLCPISHYFMMKHRHNNKQGDDQKCH